jgi:hypothetical protein
MHELVINLHMHTTYSDGHGSHAEIAQAALRAGLDAIIVTDHNVYVDGPEDYYRDGGRQVLLLVGEEIHDQARQPQKNHLLVFGAGKELSPLAYDLPRLLEAVRRAGGLAFIAHPVDPAAPAFNESDLSWVDWDVQGIHGLELWNGMSEFKTHLKDIWHAIHYIYNPQRIARGPFPEVLSKWDEILVSGQHWVAIGGSDAHELPARLGPLHRTLFPYEWHFRGINTHVLIPTPLSGEVENDRKMILEALGQGRCFIGYDLPASTRGFRFTANSLQGTAFMGDETSAEKGITLQIRLPLPAECRLIKDGKLLKTWKKRETCTYITTEPGIYRVEVYIHYLGMERGWIFSNPIYVN